MKKISFLFIFAVSLGAALPKDFVFVRELIPDIAVDLRYAGSHNFLGCTVDGYQDSSLILTREAATALKGVQDECRAFGLGLKIYDAYRPQPAVDHFVRWARDLADTTMKREFYPDVDKKDLFSKGYIASHSGHSRGSTVDLTLIDLKSGRDLDMGSPFDFFSLLSHPGCEKINAQARANRMLLQTLMVKHGFRSLDEEWWHFRLDPEPFPKTYFEFPVAGEIRR